MTAKVVPTPILVSEDCSDTAEMLLSVLTRTSACEPIPCDLLTAKQYPATSQLALTTLRTENQFFAALKQHTGSCTVLPLSTAIFRSSKEERIESQTVYIWQDFTL